MMKAILVLFFVAVAHGSGTQELKVVFKSDHCTNPTKEISFDSNAQAADTLKKGTDELHNANQGEDACTKAVFKKMYLVKDNTDVTQKQIKDLQAGAQSVAVQIKLCTGEEPVPASQPGVGLPAPPPTTRNEPVVEAPKTEVKITFESVDPAICKTPTLEITFAPDTEGTEVLKKGSEELKKANPTDAACQAKVFTKMMLVKDNADVTAKQIKDLESGAPNVCVKVKLM